MLRFVRSFWLYFSEPLSHLTVLVPLGVMLLVPSVEALQVIGLSVIGVWIAVCLCRALKYPRVSGHTDWMRSRSVAIVHGRTVRLDDLLFVTRCRVGLGDFEAAELLTELHTRLVFSVLDSRDWRMRRRLKTIGQWDPKESERSAKALDRLLLEGASYGVFTVEADNGRNTFSLAEPGKIALSALRDARPIERHASVFPAGNPIEKD